MTTARVSHLSDPRQNASAINRALRKTDALDLSPDQATILIGKPGDVTGDWNVSGAYKIASVQVVGARITGWTADTGTAEKTAHATYTGGTANAAYTQAEITAIRNALQDVSRGQKAIKDALIAHGLIGA